MLKKNISLVTTRQTKEPFGVVATNLICEQHKFAAVYDRSYFFPLYLYPHTSAISLFDQEEPTDTPCSRFSNLAPEFIADFSNRLKMQFIPEGIGDLQQKIRPEYIFDYMYAVFNSVTYRIRYADFLKTNFPRLPLTSNADLFHKLCTLGKRLVSLHLMEKSGLITTSYPGRGDDIVEKVEHTQSADQPEIGRIWINKTQYFDNVPSEVWNFHVGGYQVSHKWLKDSKGRVLSFDDIRYYQKIVSALAETIIIMEQIDEAIEEHGG
jgi:predicted helicase